MVVQPCLIDPPKLNGGVLRDQKLISIVPYGEARRGKMVSIEAWEVGRANCSREDNSGTGPAGGKLKV
jgi:hypothetical protein